MRFVVFAVALLLVLAGAFFVISPPRQSDSSGGTSVSDLDEALQHTDPDTGAFNRREPERNAVLDPEDRAPFSAKLAVEVQLGESAAEKATVGWSLPAPNVPWTLAKSPTPITQRAETNDAGQATLFVPDQPIVVWAETADHYAERELTPTQFPDGVVLKLRFDWDLRVEVLDAEEKPATNIPLALILQYEGQEGRRWGTTTTDSSGVAHFPHLGTYLSTQDDLIRPYNLPYRWFVRVDVCLEEPVELLVDASETPRGPATLTLPPTGRLRINACGPDRTSLPLDGPVWIRVADDETKWAKQIQASRHSVRVFKADVQEGVAFLDPVGLQLSLDVLAYRNPASKAATLRDVGPTDFNETKRLTVSLGSKHLIRGRIMDDAGRFVPESTFLVEITGKTGKTGKTDKSNTFRRRYSRQPPFQTHSLGSLQTDPQGIFVLDGNLSAYAETDLKLALIGTDAATEGLAVTASLVKEPGEQDLGDLSLSPLPLLLAGRVIEPNGTPVENASVSIRRGDRTEVRTDQDGRFEIRDLEYRDTFSVTAQKKRYPRVSLRKVQKGTTGLEIILACGGMIRGQLALPEGVPGHDFQVGLKMTDWEGEGVAPNRQTGMKEDGTFEYDELKAGTWSLTIKRKRSARSMSVSPKDLRRARSSSVVTTIKDIIVESGGVANVGVISALLSQSNLTLKVRDARSGAPLSGRFVVRPAGTGRVEDYVESSEFREFFGGEIRYLSEESSLDFVVGSAQHRAQLVPSVAGPRTVELEPAINLRFRLSSPDLQPADFPLEDPQLAVVLVPDHEPITRMTSKDYWSEPFGKDGSARAFAPLPGRYRVSWFVGRLVVGGGHSGRIFTGSDTVYDVLDVHDTQVFLVTPTQEVLDRVKK